MTPKQQAQADQIDADMRRAINDRAGFELTCDTLTYYCVVLSALKHSQRGRVPLIARQRIQAVGAAASRQLRNAGYADMAAALESQLAEAAS